MTKAEVIWGQHMTQKAQWRLGKSFHKSSCLATFYLACYLCSLNCILHLYSLQVIDATSLFIIPILSLAKETQESTSNISSHWILFPGQTGNISRPAHCLLAIDAATVSCWRPCLLSVCRQPVPLLASGYLFQKVLKSMALRFLI